MILLYLCFLVGFFEVDIHENNICTNLTDTFPTDDVFGIPAEKAAEAGRTWNDKLADTACIWIKFHINNMTQTAAVTDIDDFYFSEFTDAQAFSSILEFPLLKYICAALKK